jgi:hypothetical protein
LGTALFDFVFQLFQPLDDPVHAFKRIRSLMLQPNMRRFSKNADA